MTNDYLFKIIAQEDTVALNSLICAALHRSPEQISSLEVTNPILLGQALDEKEFILDVKITLNNNTFIDLELQVVNYGDWPERSLQYLCRTFDRLHRGENYLASKTAIHIGILDFSPFDDSDSLVEVYRLLNVKTHRTYTDKFQLYLINLTKADTPDNEDIEYRTDLWARFFKAGTWEELKMLAKEDEGIASAVVTVDRLWDDDEVRERALAREDYYRRERTQQLKLERALAGEKAAKDEVRVARDEAIAAKNEVNELQLLMKKQKEMADLEIESLRRQLEEYRKR